MKTLLLSLSFMLLTSLYVFSQNIGISDSGGSFTPDNSSVLELQSVSRGLLIPRMTQTQRDAVASPVAGLMIYNTTTGLVEFYNGTSWTTASEEKAYAGISFEGNTTATTISVVDTYYSVNSSSYTDCGSKYFTINTSTGQMEFTGATDKVLLVGCTGSVSSASSNQVMLCKLFINGVETGVPVERKLSSTGDVGAFAMSFNTVVSTEDVLEIKIKNITTATDFTIKHFYFYAIALD